VERREREGVQAVPQHVCMEPSNATQELKGGVFGNRITLEEEGQLTSDFAGSGVGSNLGFSQPYSATSGMCTASTEEKSSCKAEQTWSREREGVQAVPQY